MPRARTKPRSTRDPAAGRAELSFIRHLERALADAPPLQKGQRTRERLKIATAKVLSEKGYHALRVADIAEAAEVAEGSFYVYFTDKTDASLCVLTSLLEEFVAERFVADPGHASPFDAIRSTNRAWIALCRANTGLLRCVLQVGDEVPEFAELVHRNNHGWYSRVAASVVRHYPAGAVDARAALLAAYMLGSMMDELARKVLVYPQPEIEKLVASLGLSDEFLADAASVLWMRCLYPGAPLPKDLPKAANLLAAWPAADRPMRVSRG